MSGKANDQDATGATQPSLFISYARVDREKVRPLVDALTAANYAVWWDALIEGGAAFAMAIEDKLAAAEAVIVVWSVNSVTSDWVRDEAAHARDRKHLVPITLDGTPSPLGFGQYHAIDFSKWRGKANEPQVESLIRGIAGMGGQYLPERSIPRAKPGGLSRRATLIGGAGVAIAATTGGILWFRPFGESAGANSVAVLPFTNLSNDRDQAYFADGLAEEVRATLARNASLQVAAPTSSKAFRDHSEDARTVGRKLGVAYLLEGSVRRAGDAVRVIAELTDAHTGFNSWSQTFDRNLNDIFSVQSDIANTVAAALAAKVTPVTKAGGTKIVPAYDAYLRGRALFNADGGETSDRQALAQYDAAIAIDPNYAEAHAARSRVLAAIATAYASADQLRPMFNSAIAAAQMAVALEPDLAGAQLALGYALYTGRLDVKGARAPYNRAAALGGGDADILLLYALYSARDGRAEVAKAAIARALVLDPVNARAWRAAGLVDYAARRHADAIGNLRQALDLNSKLSAVHGLSGFALLQLGRDADARTQFLLEGYPPPRLSGLAIVERKLSNRPAAQKARDALTRELGDSVWYQQAQVSAQWGEPDAALDALDRAYKIGDAGMVTLKVDPLLDPVRNSPRFANLLKRMGFE